MMTKYFTFVILVVFSLLSCDRYIKSEDPVRDLPATGEPAENLAVAYNSQSIILSWEIADISAVSSFLIDLYDSTYIKGDKDQEPIETYQTSSLNYEITDLVSGHKYTFIVSPVYSSGLEGEASRPLTIRFSNLFLFINNNDQFSNGQAVLLTINSLIPVKEMIISEDSSFADASNEPFQAAKEFRLSGSDGSKRVFVSLFFDDGSSTDRPISDSIILDTQVEIDSLVFIASDTILTGDSILFNLYAKEVGGIAAVSFGTVNNLKLFDDASNGDIIIDDAVYSGYYEVPVGFSLINGTVRGTLQDLAGNKITAFASKTITIYSQPQPALLSAVAVSTYQISLSWSQEPSTDFHAYRLFRDTATLVTEASTQVITITNKFTTTYIDSSLDDNSTYFYKLFTDNISGNTGASNEVEETTFFNFAPDALLLSSSFTADPGVVEVTWTKSNEVDFGFYILTRDTLNPGLLSDDSRAIGIENNRDSTFFFTYLPDTMVYYFQLFVEDRHGLRAGSNIISVKR